MRVRRNSILIAIKLNGHDKFCKWVPTSSRNRASKLVELQNGAPKNPRLAARLQFEPRKGRISYALGLAHSRRGDSEFLPSISRRRHLTISESSPTDA